MKIAIRPPLIATASAAALAAWALAPAGTPPAAQAQDAAAPAAEEAATAGDTQGRAETAATDASTEAGLPGIEPMVLGSEDAPVSMIEYASFTCPHCADFHEEVWPAIKRDYVDAGLVRFEYREVFFDRPGLWASMVARCGDGMRFFGIADLIYENQGDWARGQPAEIAEGLRRIGLAAGLSDEQLDACLADGETAQALVARFEEQAEADGITATPSFVIDGELQGNMSLEELRSLLDEKVEAAE